MYQLTEIPSWADSVASQRLSELCSKGEGQQVEFKECLPSQGHDIGKSIAAFASSNAGVLLYGVSNDGSVVGIENGLESTVRDQVSQRIFSAAKDVRPPVHPIVVWAHQDGKAVCVVEVERGFAALYFSNHRPILRRGCMSRPAEASEVDEVYRLRYSSNASAGPLPSTRLIAKRMSSVLSKMNERRSEPLGVSDLALAMELPAPADLEAVLVGQAPATFQLLDRFCSRFAVNKEWLISGRSSPFHSEVEHRLLPEKYLSLIEDADCDTVYVVRSASEVGEAFLVIESDPLKFWRLPDVWHVSACVGGGGARALVSLYALFKKWSSGTKPYMVLGRHIKPPMAEAIWNGQMYPGVIADMPLSHWWDDLTDLDHKWTSPKDSINAYGKQFVAAQDIIRQMLERD